MSADEFIAVGWLDHVTGEMRTDGCIQMRPKVFKSLLRTAAEHAILRHIAISDDEHCWHWTGQVDKYGYGIITGVIRAHRVTWEIFSESRLEPGVQVRHQCDTPSCCNPFHLLSGTVADNVQDRVARGRSAKGERNGRAKITARQAGKIRVSNESHAVLGRRYGINPSTVRDIKNGVIWKTIFAHKMPISRG